jgi:hypothetical protein
LRKANAPGSVWKNTHRPSRRPVRGVEAFHTLTIGEASRSNDRTSRGTAPDHGSSSPRTQYTKTVIRLATERGRPIAANERGGREPGRRRHCHGAKPYRIGDVQLPSFPTGNEHAAEADSHIDRQKVEVDLQRVPRRAGAGGVEPLEAGRRSDPPVQRGNRDSFFARPIPNRRTP